MCVIFKGRRCDMTNQDQLIKVITQQGITRYISTDKTRNGLNRVYDEDYNSVTMCALEQAIMMGIYVYAEVS